MTWEVIGVVTGIIALAVAIQTYHRQFNIPPPVFPEQEPTAEKENLKAHFKMNQRISLKIQALLQKQIDLGFGNNLIFGTYTFIKYYEFVKSEYEDNLNDNLYNNLDTLPVNKHHIDSMVKSLQAQFQNLQLVKNHLKLL
ncbi:hypothetical protein [Flavobacterium rhizosphaerae]|uniref:DUF4760 domain-containing protein n=1 Tax=Flavobacterium rhizosphaerae TaxID=3163298 RepID=A0ABW8YVG3_9FLAO